MGDSMEFASREAFRSWLSEHGQSSAGVWLLFGKAGGPKTLKAGEALEEALCFGWIDGQMQRIDEKSYRKYFSQRRDRSKWSEKNKALVQVLEEQGLMTDLGRAKVEEAKRNGQWYAPNPPLPIFRPCPCPRGKPTPGPTWMPKPTPDGKSGWPGWWTGWIET